VGLHHKRGHLISVVGRAVLVGALLGALSQLGGHQGGVRRRGVHGATEQRDGGEVSDRHICVAKVLEVGDE
jgi:hypothetical protein